MSVLFCHVLVFSLVNQFSFLLVIWYIKCVRFNHPALAWPTVRVSRLTPVPFACMWSTALSPVLHVFLVSVIAPIVISAVFQDEGSDYALTSNLGIFNPHAWFSSCL